MLGLTSVDRVSASDPKSALALQRLVQAAVSITIYSDTLLILWLLQPNKNVELSFSFF